MLDQPADTQPHISVEFVGGPYCGAVADSRTQLIRASVLRRLASAAKGDRPVELLVRAGCPRLVRVKVQGARRGSSQSKRERLHRYQLLVELGFASRVLFRANYDGALTA